MSLFINTSHRSSQKEMMDDFSLEGEMLRDTLDKLENINKYLGGNRTTMYGLKKILKNTPKNTPITIVDIGCGHGDIIREVARFGRANNYRFKLIGIDANSDAIAYANKLSTNYPEVSFKALDIFSEDFYKLEYEIVLSTLFFHHFKNDRLVSFLRYTLQKATIGIVVNDLHRHKLAYYLFKFMGLFITNKMVREDGLTSVLRAFKKKDLVRLSKQITPHYSIQWKWAFRYLWVLKKPLQPLQHNRTI